MRNVQFFHLSTLLFYDCILLAMPEKLNLGRNWNLFFKSKMVVIKESNNIVHDTFIFYV